MVFRLNSEVLEDGIRPKALHMILKCQSVSDSAACTSETLPNFQPAHVELGNEYHILTISESVIPSPKKRYCPPGPFAAASASSPMKKSKSSVPRFIDRWPPGPAPPVRYEGLLATAGRPDPELAAPPAPLLVAIAVGKTNEGESLPAKPNLILLSTPSLLLTNNQTHLALRNQCRWSRLVSN